jgi:hypothetical protein
MADTQKQTQGIFYNIRAEPKFFAPSNQMLRILDTLAIKANAA